MTAPLTDTTRGTGAADRWPWWLPAAAAALLLAGATSAVAARRFVFDVPLATVPSVDIVRAFYDTTPIRITTTMAWTTTPETVEVHRLHTDWTVWRRMFFRDWDGLSDPPRRTALGAMIDHYRPLLTDRTAGAALTSSDWDLVPQPIRAMAFVNMIEHWAARYRPGRQFGLDEAEVLRTIKAICMSESWFEHRAVNTNSDGSSDVGLAQASRYARLVTQRWTAAGLWDLPMDDEDYLNPWHATRWLVAWFNLMLDEADGDIELAIRAYNVGRPRARTEGEPYLRVVLARRARYFEGPSGSPTWQILSESRRAALSAHARSESTGASTPAPEFEPASSR
ncbi:MAG: transglycosylase SLT domain-containing protein [Acidobacteria bacterium]|nr:transglycosylase SLT domain-containing protein [Acidobacteriota bacterium]